jgi:hypothetical protein
MRPKVLDYVSILVSAAAVVLFSFLAYGGAHGASELIIEAGGKRWIYPLTENRIEKVHGPLGDTTVVVEDGKAFIGDSPCPDKLCERAGRISRTGQWIACMPNGIIVRIGGAGGDGTDDTSF